MTTSKSPGPGADTAEPRVTAGLIALEEGDFHALSDPLSKDAQYNDRRLVLRRKLLGLARDNKILLTKAGDNVLRLLPPLIIDQSHIDEATHKLDLALAAYASEES